MYPTRSVVNSIVYVLKAVRLKFPLWKDECRSRQAFERIKQGEVGYEYMLLDIRLVQGSVYTSIRQRSDRHPLGCTCVTTYALWISLKQLQVHGPHVALEVVGWALPV